MADPPKRIALWRAALIGFLLAGLLSLGLAAREQNAVFDGLQQLFPRDLSQSDVRVIAIGDESLDVIGSWPWPRGVLATLTQRLSGASAIGFDILFSEPDAVSPDRFNRLYPSDDPAIRAWMNSLNSQDSDFAEAIGAAPVVLGRVGVTRGGTDPAELTQWATIKGSPPPDRLTFPRVQRNLEVLEARASGYGLMNGRPDDDGRIRSVPLIMQTGDALVPGLALDLVRAAQDSDTGTDPDILLTPGSLTIGPVTVPIDSDGRMRPHFGEVPQEHIYSAIEVMGEDFDPGAFDGKIVVVSLTAEGTADIVATPLEPELFGVLLQAQTVDALRRGGWLSRPAIMAVVEWLVGLLLALTVLVLANRTAAATRWALFVSALVVLPAASVLLFLHIQLLFDPIRPLLLGGGTALAVVGALFSEARRERAVLRDAQNRSEGELGAARAIQLGMLPDRAALARLDPRIDIAARLEAAKSVGGDFYDIIRLDDDRIVIIIADVTGKGVPAALFMALSKALTKSVMLRATSDLAETAALLNAELMRDSGDQLGLTMLLCLVDLTSGTVEMVNAGHDNPLRIGTDGSVREEALEGGPPFCIIDYPWPAERLTLLPGEALVLITDGVTEAQNRSQQLFGNQRTRDALLAGQGSAAAMVDNLCLAVRRFEDGTDASDDLTVVALRYLGATPA